MNVVFTMFLTVGMFLLLSLISGPLLMRNFVSEAELWYSFCAGVC